MRRPLVVASVVVALLLGAIGGYFLGRWKLDHEWRQVRTTITPERAMRSSEGDANPTPTAGASVLLPMPLARTRVAMREMVAKDPLVMTVGAVGRDDEEVGLHLTFENRGTCAIVAYSGIAYGFDAWGRPSKMNRAGEHYVAISGVVEKPLSPGETFRHEQLVLHVDEASLALAHVDRVQCEGGTSWERPL